MKRREKATRDSSQHSPPQQDAPQQGSAQGVPPSGGEGDRAGDRRYREGASRFARSPQVQQAAEEAEAALRGEEGPELREAEKQARSRARDYGPDATNSRE
jgi:hypothetical protein